MPPCGFTRACVFLLVVFAAAIQDIRAAITQEHPKLDYHAIARVRPFAFGFVIPSKVKGISCFEGFAIQSAVGAAQLKPGVKHQRNSG